RGIDPRQDHARRHSDRAGPELSALRFRPAQGILDARASGGARRAWSVCRAPAHVCAGDADPSRVLRRGKSMARHPRALLFDVFGTVVDWRGSIVREARRAGRAHGVSADWGAFADAWRAGYRPAMDRVR